MSDPNPPFQFPVQWKISMQARNISLAEFLGDVKIDGQVIDGFTFSLAAFVNSGLYATVPAALVACDAAAFAANAPAILDYPVTLTSNTTLTANWIGNQRGAITLGNFNLTGSFYALPNVQMFVTGGTGDVIFTNDTTVEAGWFGYKGNNVAGSAAANVAALKGLISFQSPSLGFSGYNGNRNIPAGFGYVNGSITAQTAAGFVGGLFKGQGSAVSRINQTAAVKTFDLTNSAEVFAKDFGLIGGTVGFYFDTNNNDQSMFRFENMYFNGQTVASIQSSTDSNSSHVVTQQNVVTNCALFVDQYYDYHSSYDDWSEPVAGNGVFQIREGALRLYSFEGAGASQSGGGTDTWINTTGASIASIASWNGRFNTDGGGHRQVVNYGANSGKDIGASIFFRNNQISQNGTVLPSFVFSSLPPYIDIQDTYRGGNGVVALQALAAARADGSLQYWVQGNVKLGQPYRWYTSGADKALELAVEQRNSITPCVAKQYRMADLTISYLSTALVQQAVSNMTAATAAYPYLGGVAVLQLTATADGASAYYNRSDVLVTGALTNNANYTLVMDFFLTGTQPCSVRVTCCGQTTYASLIPGLNIVNCPFTWLSVDAGATALEVALNVDDMGNTGVLQVGRWRVFAGRVQIDDTRNNVFDTQAAALANVQWNKGDTWTYTDPAAATPPGKVCTTAGIGGASVFKAQAALAA